MTNRVLKKREKYERDNIEAALLILSDPRLNADEETLAVKWTRLTLARHGHMPLVEERAA